MLDIKLGLKNRGVTKFWDPKMGGHKNNTTLLWGSQNWFHIWCVKVQNYA